MPGKLNGWRVMRTLGSGASCKVKLGQNIESGRQVAIKIMNDDMDADLKELLDTECQAMEKLKHLNIIEQIEVGNGEYKKDNGKSKTVMYIILELAGGGELFDYIAISGRFEEPLARYYFKEFMNGLSECHKQGYTHRDLKPENILLDKQFTLKIADFGFAGPINGRDGKSGYLKTKLGTSSYMAPEIHLRQPYQGESIDLFAAAIILFIMVAQHPPFVSAQPQDPYYRCLAAKRSDVFWQTHGKSKPAGFFSEEFKDLVQGLLQLEPKNRLTMQQVMDHAWLKGDTMTKNQVIAEFKNRDKMVKDSIEADRLEKQKTKQGGNKDYRAGNAEDEEQKATEELKKQEAAPPKKDLKPYMPACAKQTQFFSSESPDYIEELILKNIQESNQVIGDPKIKKNGYKIDYVLNRKAVSGAEVPLEMTVRILQAADNVYCVEFQKSAEANQFMFTEYYKELTTMLKEAKVIDIADQE